MIGVMNVIHVYPHFTARQKPAIGSDGLQTYLQCAFLCRFFCVALLWVPTVLQTQIIDRALFEAQFCSGLHLSISPTYSFIDYGKTISLLT